MSGASHPAPARCPVLELRDFSPRSATGFRVAPYSLTLERGGSVALVGPAGAGKSLFLHALFDGTLAYGGDYLLEGERVRDPDSPRVRARLGVCFQEDALLDDRSALANVEDAVRGRGLSDPRSRAREALAQVGLTEAEDRAVAALSGGMRRRVGIARALAVEPQLLLCDEPTRGLDPDTAREVLEVLLSWTSARGAALVVTTHDVNTVVARVDQVVVFEEGKVAFAGSLAALPPGSPYAPCSQVQP